MFLSFRRALRLRKVRHHTSCVAADPQTSPESSASNPSSAEGSDESPLGSVYQTVGSKFGSFGSVGFTSDPSAPSVSQPELSVVGSALPSPGVLSCDESSPGAEPSPESLGSTGGVASISNVFGVPPSGRTFTRATPWLGGIIQKLVEGVTAGSVATLRTIDPSDIGKTSKSRSR